MKRIMLAIALLSSFLLIGCASQPPAAIITPTNYIVVRPTPELLKVCVTTPPPDVATYMALSKEQREKLMSEYSIALLGDLNVCNQRWLAFPKWFDDQQSAYKVP